MMTLFSILEIIPRTIESLVCGMFLKFALDAIGCHFELPTFGYWVCVSVSFVVITVLDNIRPSVKQEVKERDAK